MCSEEVYIVLQTAQSHGDDFVVYPFEFGGVKIRLQFGDFKKLVDVQFVQMT